MAPRTERSGSLRVRAFFERHAHGFDSLGEVADAIASYRPGAKRPSGLTNLARSVRRGEDGRLYWHWDPRFIDGRERDFETRFERLAPAA